MDFAKRLTEEEGVASKANIHILPTQSDDKSLLLLDSQLIVAANRAARDLFLGPSSSLKTTAATEEEEAVVNSRLYRERCLAPPTKLIAAKDLVVIFESFDSLSFVYVTPGQTFSNRNGHFPHMDFVGRPYGCKIRSRSRLGFVHLLRPTPELWSRSLTHRTQIVHELDSSLIVFQLHLRPNSIVMESGTGSGAMSHALLRTIAPYGVLHTFEFHRERVDRARTDFAQNGISSDRVHVHWRDVCNEGFGVSQSLLLTAHAIFLDLPEPWLAIPHAASAIKPNGRIGTYSPCVEQVQRTIQVMKKYGFHTIKTLEVRLREHYVDQIQLETLCEHKLPREQQQPPPPCNNHPLPQQQHHDNEKNTNLLHNNTDTNSSNGDDETASAKNADTNNNEHCQANEALSLDGNGDNNNNKRIGDFRSGAVVDVVDPDEKTFGNADISSSTTPALGRGGGDETRRKIRKMLCTRPFSTMRGHTAFLTFATAGNKSQQHLLDRTKG